MTTHMADCRVSYCRGCVSPEIADLGVEARAALIALAAEAQKGADQ